MGNVLRYAHSAMKRAGAGMHQRTIAEVVDSQTGERIAADDFFARLNDPRHSQAWVFAERRQAQEALSDGGETRYRCGLCGQSVRPRGAPGGVVTMHFAHAHGSGDCPWRTDLSYTRDEINAMRYQGQKESDLHYRLKTFLAAALTKQGLVAQVEPVVKGRGLEKHWRRPDVSTTFKGIDVVFELQVSNTYLDVIVERERFYRRNGTWVIWVFPEFDPGPFTAKDIIYGNNQHAFVLNQRARDASRAQGRLVLEAFYPQGQLSGNAQAPDADRWTSALVSLEDLVFDSEAMLVYYADHARFRARVEACAARGEIGAVLRFAVRHRYWDEQRALLDRLIRESVRTGRCARLASNHDVSSLLRLIAVLLSFECGTVVGSNLANLKAVAHLVIEHEIQYLGHLLAAALAYGRLEALETDAVRRKLHAYRARGAEPAPCHAFDGVIEALFPAVAAVSGEARRALFRRLLEGERAAA